MIAMTVATLALVSTTAFAHPPVDVEIWDGLTCEQARQELNLTARDTCTVIDNPGSEATWSSEWYPLRDPAQQRQKDFAAIFGGDEDFEPESDGTYDDFYDYGSGPFPIPDKDFGAIFGGS